MKIKTISLFILSLLIIWGCTQSLPPSSLGIYFPDENVRSIAKGKTTDKDIIQMFGEPLSKTITPDTEKWTYTYASGNATVVRTFTTVGTKYRGKSKKLDILFKNGVVTDFTFYEANVIQ
jgi:hypothetical protein